MEKFFSQKLFSQKMLLPMTLVVGLFLGSCDLVFKGEFYSSADFGIYENLQEVYRTVNIDGLYDTDNQTLLTFDTNNNILTITNIASGVSTSEGSYYLVPLSEDGATNSAFQLQGIYDKYLGMSLLPNKDGSFLKFHIQDREFVVQETTSDMTYYNYASDSLIFRLHKNYLDTIAYNVDSSGKVIPGGANFTASIPKTDEYAFNSSDGGDSTIDTSTTTLYVLDDSSIEVMTKDGGGYIVIEYDNNSTKMKMIELDSSVTISKSSVVSALASAKEYDFPPILDEPDPDPEPEPSAALVGLIGGATVIILAVETFALSYDTKTYYSRNMFLGEEFLYVDGGDNWATYGGIVSGEYIQVTLKNLLKPSTRLNGDFAVYKDGELYKSATMI